MRALLRNHKLIAVLFLLATPLSALAQAADWVQWGGPHRNFTAETKGLAAKWPESGPRRVWQRELGEGYSAIAVERGMLYTMYRKGENEVAIALDAATGKTVWEYSYAAPFSPEYDVSHGPGPHATPLVAGNFVFTSGATGKLHCLDKKTGKVVWAHDLMSEFHGTVRVNGYSCSPIAYKDKVVMMVGGPASSLVAFNLPSLPGLAHAYFTYQKPTDAVGGTAHVNERVCIERRRRLPVPAQGCFNPGYSTPAQTER